MGLHKRGQVLLWRSVKRRKYPGYQFSADVEGCDTLVAVVAELRQGRLLKRPFNLTEPSPKAFGGRLPITGNENVFAFQTLHLVLALDLREDLRVEETDAHIALTFSEKGLGYFLEGVDDVRNGRGDWAIGGATRGDAVWFWWLETPDR